MTYTKSCTVCGAEFEAKRRDAKFCSQVCKRRFYRGAPLAVPDAVPTSVPAVPDPAPAVHGDLLEAIESQAQVLLDLCRKAIDAGIERYDVTWALSEQGWRRMSREEREYHQDLRRSIA